MELARRLQLGRAIRAARHVLLQFVTSIVGQFVVDVQQNIFFNPFAFHNCTPSGEILPLLDRTGETPAPTLHRMSASAPRNFWVARNKVFLAVSSVVFNISPTVRNFSP